MADQRDAGRTISPTLALFTAGVAVSLLAVVALRTCDPETTDPALAIAADAGPSPPDVDAAVLAVKPLPTPEPPIITSVQATVATAKVGVELRLAIGLELPTRPGRRELISIRARCHLDGEWYDGHGGILLDKLDVGAHAVVTTVAVGAPHRLETVPAACHLAFDHLGARPRGPDRPLLAHLCWNGREIVNEACAPIPHTPPLVDVRALRVQTSLDRRASYTVGTPLSLSLELDAQLRRDVSNWSLELIGECRLPDGTTVRDTGPISLHGVHPARPFTQPSWLFARTNLPVTPDQCTFALELADLYRLVREPIAAWCWRDRKLAPGRCPAA